MGYSYNYDRHTLYVYSKEGIIDIQVNKFLIFRLLDQQLLWGGYPHINKFSFYLNGHGISWGVPFILWHRPHGCHYVNTNNIIRVPNSCCLPCLLCLPLFYAMVYPLSLDHMGRYILKISQLKRQQYIPRICTHD